MAERCKRVGFTAYDVTALAGIVAGYIRDRPMSPRAEIELLMSAFAFDATESEGVIRFVPRGRAAVAEFDIDDCVLPDQGDILKLTRAQETDLPDIVSVTFIDGNINYGQGTISASRIAGYSERKTEVGMPLVMDEIQAQAIADRTLAEAWIGRETARYALPPGRIDLDVGDVVNLVIDGRPREFRLTRINDAWSRAIEAQRSEGAVYAPLFPSIKPPAFESPPIYGRAILELMDLPMLRENDVGFAPYVAASATPFAGITLLDSATGADYALDTVLPVRAIIGETVFDFWPGPTAYFDIVNTLRVKLYSGEIVSLDEATILSGRANALAIRNAEGDWEILQFCNAALVDAGVYDLSKLLRGRLGTEHAMRNPVAAGARVVVLDGAIAQIQAALAERGVTRFYKWGPSVLDSSDVAWQQGTFTARGVGLMPWSPVHVAGTRNGSGDLSITWVRRTRLGGVWADGADVPLNEESERYEVDILDGANVARTIATTLPAATYTAAQQTADFGSPQPSIAVRVYQLSATVGRGRPAAATL